MAVVVQHQAKLPDIVRLGELSKGQNLDAVLADVSSMLDKVKDVANLEDRKKVYMPWISDRVSLLTRGSKPTFISSFSDMTKCPFNGFIHPETKVVRSAFTTDHPLLINDNDAYVDLIETIRDFQKAGYGEKPIASFASNAITLAIGRYYGNVLPDPEAERKNVNFYLDRDIMDETPVNLKDMRGMGIAVCVEKSALAQNFISFLGFDSSLITGECTIDGTKGEHAYNVIHRNGKHAIYDPANPVLLRNDSTGAETVLAASYMIEDEKYKDLLKGKPVEVEHVNLVEKEGSRVPGEKSRRVYFAKV